MIPTFYFMNIYIYIYIYIYIATVFYSFCLIDINYMLLAKSYLNNQMTAKSGLRPYHNASLYKDKPGSSSTLSSSSYHYHYHHSPSSLLSPSLLSSPCLLNYSSLTMWFFKHQFFFHTLFLVGRAVNIVMLGLSFMGQPFQSLICLNQEYLNHIQSYGQ